MRLYFKNRNSPKAYKVVITALDTSHIGFIGEITNPTMKIGNGVVQFYLAPIASKGTWTINEDYHFKDGKLTLMAYKNLVHTSYNSHATYIDFTKNIQLALELTEFHSFEIIGIVVKELTSLADADWMYDAENKKILYFNTNTSGSLTLNQVATGINSSLISQNNNTKTKSELFVKELIKDLFRTQPKGLLKASEFNSDFIANAVITELGDKEYLDTSVNQYTTSSLNFSKGLVDRIPGTTWNTEGNATVVEGGEAFSHTVLKTTEDITDSLVSSTSLFKGNTTPLTLSFDFLIKENQTDFTNLPLFSKNTNGSNGDQILYLSNNKLVFERREGVGGNTITPVYGLHKIEFNTKYSIKFLFDGNMIKCFVNDKLDFKVGSNVGLYTSSNQPYRFLNTLVPVYNSFRAMTNGYIDNVQIDDGVARDSTSTVDPYKEKLVTKLSFQGQANKTIFVDEAKSSTTWTGYGDAKLVVEDTYLNYSYLNLNGMSSYLSVDNADYLAFTGTKFSIRMSFKTSTTSKEQCLFDRYESGKPGCYNISLTSAGSIVFYYVPSSSYQTFVSNAYGLNDGNKHSVDIIKEGNSLLIYVDDILDSIHDVTGIKFDHKIVKTSIGAQVQTRNESYDFNGQIYDLTIYDGVAVYPNLVVKNLDTIELDFNKNLIQDVKGNSTWTNTGITLDRNKSFNGYSAQFTTITNKLQTNSNIFNFGTGNFYTEANLNSSPVVTGEYRYYMTTADTPQDTGSIWYHASGSILGIDHNPRPDNYNVMSYNYVASGVYYNHKTIRKNGVLHNIVNDVVCNTAIHNLDFNLNKNNTTTLGMHPNFAVTNRSSFKGSLDDFKAIKGYQDVVNITSPAVHFPFTLDSVNTGYTPLIVTPVGNPQHSVVDGKKCIKFESGKYVRIDSNNIFKLGASSDFYIEMDYFFVKNGSNVVPLISSYSGQPFTDICVTPEGNPYIYRETGPGVGKTSFNSTEACVENVWNKIIFKRKDNETSFVVNSIETKSTIVFDIDLTLGYTMIGNTRAVPGSGYMSNFKMFVGTSEPPKGYDDKKVLDLDFKPTYKSYLFKDNNNKCVINPFGITHREYEDNQYAVGFNGVDQYLALGKNNNLNMGKDDFVLKIKFKVSDFARTWQRLISDNDVASGSKNYIMITGDDYSMVDKRFKVFFGLDDNASQYMFSTTSLVADVEYVLKIVRNGNEISMFLDDNLENTLITTYPFNLNSNNNTFIGAGNRVETISSSQAKQLFKGFIYSVKLLRNTSDITLLDDVVLEPESPADTNDTGVPPLEKGVLNFWQLRQEVDPRNLVLEFNQLRLE